jgi:hypothetical protein
LWVVFVEIAALGSIADLVLPVRNIGMLGACNQSSVLIPNLNYFTILILYYTQTIKSLEIQGFLINATQMCIRRPYAWDHY